MSEKFLKVEDLVVEYRTGGKVVHAVNNVSFELERGKTLGLVGETGAGKTTIAKTILRVLPEWKGHSGWCGSFISQRGSNEKGPRRTGHDGISGSDDSVKPNHEGWRADCGSNSKTSDKRR